MNRGSTSCGLGRRRGRWCAELSDPLAQRTNGEAAWRLRPVRLGMCPSWHHHLHRRRAIRRVATHVAAMLVGDLLHDKESQPKSVIGCVRGIRYEWIKQARQDIVRNLATIAHFNRNLDAFVPHLDS